nr:hypothetical protein [Candidatus Sigynarchaeota archaeon]
MKRQFFTIICAVSFLLSTWLIPAKAQTDYAGYLGIKPGDSFTYTYTLTPVDITHQSPMSVDLPFVIESIVDINSTSCNVTYNISYKVLVDGIPKDQVNRTKIMLSNTINASNIAAYIYSLKSPWEVFFINMNTGIRKVTLSNATEEIGTGHIAWTDKGNLDNATLHTQVGGIPCTISIVIKTSPPVPGYSPAIIVMIMIIPTAWLAYKVVKKSSRKKNE